MPEHDSRPADCDWRLTTFDGARREQLRRWAQLPLERILLALEDMQDIARLLGAPSASDRAERIQGAPD
jgi:hypothetical protein